MILMVEGPNGSGKTYFQERIKHIPGVIFFSVKQTNALKPLLEKWAQRQTFDLDEKELLQVTAAHIELYENARRAIEKGTAKVVVLDRSVASFYVYQYLSGGTTSFRALDLYHSYLKPIEPYLTMVHLNPSLETLKQRLLKRGDANHLLDIIGYLKHHYEDYFKQERTPDFVVKNDQDLESVVTAVMQVCMS